MAVITAPAHRTKEEELAELVEERRKKIRLKLLSIIEGAGLEGCYINDLCLIESCFDVCHALAYLVRKGTIKYRGVDRVRMVFLS
jgi:hypothetical protein